ncbi:pentapeptide repeat-containing protein [Streptomyces rhizosphaericus]|uniref:pentapeptide repeat-containing protein n=1 Tax=Streptomyces rhizosphaericus TaxID=114699 RepID=UPI00142DE8B6|nr:pentapeptide repeat-containing protein [Streptomyces rhizosphaericus]
MALVFPVMAAVVALLLGPATNWLLGSGVSKIKEEDKRELVINGARQTLLAAAAGTAAVTTLVFTSLAYSLSHKNHIIDRLEKARTNLTSAAAASDRDRLLSVYTLEGIMRTSPGERIAIMNILANFIRLRAGTPSPHTPSTSPAADIQAALAALGNWSNRSKSDLDLRNINLTHADFRSKNFKTTDFSGSNLQDAKFDNAELREVIFRGSLSRASFRNSDLRGAKFEAVRVIDSPFSNAKLGRVTLRGNMSGANFSRAKMKSASLEGSMQGTDFTGVDLRKSTLKGNVEDANFRGADLRGADLTGLYGLSRDQLQVANVNEKTALPRYLRP